MSVSESLEVYAIVQMFFYKRINKVLSKVLKIYLAKILLVTTFSLMAFCLIMPLQNLHAATCPGHEGAAINELPAELAELIGNHTEGANAGNEGACKAPPQKTVEKTPKITQVSKKINISNRAIEAIHGNHVPDEVLVTISADGGSVNRLANQYGLTIRSQKALSLLGSILVKFGIPDGRPVAVVRAQLLSEQDVLGAEPNHIYELNGEANKAVIKRFSQTAAEINKAQKLASGRGIKVAVIDSGVDEDHPALLGAVRGKFNALDKAPVNDTSHGTAVALLIGGGDDGFKGAAPEVELYVARAFDKTKEGVSLNSAEAILTSLDWAFQQNVDIINMSFAGPENRYIKDALSNLLSSDVVLVAAAGNNGKKAPFAYPAAHQGVFAVTATDAKNRIYTKANRGPYVYIAAPGVDVLVADGSGDIQLRSGTSYGAAIFSGICALALEGQKANNTDGEPNKRMKLKEFRKAIELSSKDLGAPGRDPVFGNGLIRAEALVRHALK